MLRTAGPDEDFMGPLATMKMNTRLFPNKVKIECVLPINVWIGRNTLLVSHAPAS
jgi:hypothetical protein